MRLRYYICGLVQSDKSYVINYIVLYHLKSKAKMKNMRVFCILCFIIVMHFYLSRAMACV